MPLFEQAASRRWLAPNPLRLSRQRADSAWPWDRGHHQPDFRRAFPASKWGAEIEGTLGLGVRSFSSSKEETACNHMPCRAAEVPSCGCAEPRLRASAWVAATFLAADIPPYTMIFATSSGVVVVVVVAAAAAAAAADNDCGDFAAAISLP